MTKFLFRVQFPIVFGQAISTGAGHPLCWMGKWQTPWRNWHGGAELTVFLGGEFGVLFWGAYNIARKTETPVAKAQILSHRQS